MKQQISLILLMVLLFSFSSFITVCADEFASSDVQAFEYYVVSNSVYDMFLQNIDDIEYLKNNSKFAAVTDFSTYITYGQDVSKTLNGDVAEYLSDRLNFCETMYLLGLNVELHDYVIFTTPNIGNEANMPISVWLKTSDGVKFATLKRVGDNNPNFFKLFRIDIYEPDEYVRKFSERPGKLFIFNTEKNFSYIEVRNEGANFGLRELMEDLGISVIWNEEDTSITLMSPAEVNSNWGLKLQLGDYSTEDEAYNVTQTIIRPGTERDGEQTTYFVKMIDDKTIVSNRVASYQLNWLLRKDYDDVLYEMNIDNDKGIVNLYTLED